MFNDILIAEAILDGVAEANRTWAKYALNRYYKGLKPFGGGAMISNACLPRYWNVKVGERVKK